MSFLQAEKRRQTEWKLRTSALTRGARTPGLFGNRLFPFCLPVDYAEENLWSGTRHQVIQYFLSNGIVWHTGALPGCPSNHLCSSQVFLVNLFAPFQNRRALLHRLMMAAYPDLTGVMPIEAPDQYLAFEWVPPSDLLREGSKRGLSGGLKRGIGNTSIDFVFLGRVPQGGTVLVLGEAKYTEHYPTRLVDSAKATQRIERYERLIDDAGWLTSITREEMRALATEPVFQTLRHHLLAHQLWKHYDPIDEVRILHLYVARKGSTADEESPVLRSHQGMGLLEGSPVPFRQVSAQELFCHIEGDLPEELRGWQQYMSERYRL